MSKKRILHLCVWVHFEYRDQVSSRKALTQEENVEFGEWTHRKDGIHGSISGRLKIRLSLCS